MDNIVMSHWTAAKALRVPYLETFFSKFLRGPEEYTVFCIEDRFYEEDVLVHVCRGEFPSSAITDPDDSPIVSPEYLFVQLCFTITIIPAILLGCLMCSPLGGRPALTSREKLQSFISESTNIHGRSRAKDALTYIEENFSSPMEILLYMFICLPFGLGSCGMPERPDLDQMMALSAVDAGRLREKLNYSELGLSNPVCKIVFEYYSSVLCEKVLDEDSDVIPVWTGDRYSLKHYEKLFRYIVGKSLMRLRMRLRFFKDHFYPLRMRLPGAHVSEEEALDFFFSQMSFDSRVR